MATGKKSNENQSSTPVDQLKRKPAVVDCPHCAAHGLTRTEKEGSLVKVYVCRNFYDMVYQLALILALSQCCPECLGLRDGNLDSCAPGGASKARGTLLHWM